MIKNKLSLSNDQHKVFFNSLSKLPILFSALLFGCGGDSVNQVDDSVNQGEEPPIMPTEGVLAFPGAEGFGRYAVGGRGGDVYHVTNLDNDGEGSLRHGVETAAAPLTIVFDISGTILLRSRLTLDSAHMTIAGQTAPGDGITLSGNSLIIAADHIIVRFIRSRLGDTLNVEADAISVVDGSNIIIDHSTASWSVDEVLSNQSNTVDLMTLQWSIVSESLHNSLHAKGAHGYGGIIGAKRQTYHHNLFAHHSSRNPKITWRRHTKVDFSNNVIYNWGFLSCYDGTSTHANWTNNYYKAGPATDANVNDLIFDVYNKPDAPDFASYGTQFYISGNVIEGNEIVSSDNWQGGVTYQDGTTEEDVRALQAFDYPKIAETSAEQAFSNVLDYAGASLNRDDVDNRVVQEARTGTAAMGINGLIDSQFDVGGWPLLESLPAQLDTDQDGMPDVWENIHNLDSQNPEDRNSDTDGDGYTELEEYLNSLALSTFPEGFTK